MKLWVRGHWYDAENEHLVVKLTEGDQENIANMVGEFYSAAPDDFGLQQQENMLEDAVNQEQWQQSEVNERARG